MPRPSGSLHPIIRKRYRIHDWRNAIAILSGTHPNELRDIQLALHVFKFTNADVLKGGGSKGPMARLIDRVLIKGRGWKEKKFDIRLNVDGASRAMPTHKVDCYRNRVALEVEWNNKDTFYDRDLNNFRLLFELRAIDVGVIITRSSTLQARFRAMVKSHGLSKDKYVASTTHYRKLRPRLESGGSGGCPVLVFAITRRVWR